MIETFGVPFPHGATRKKRKVYVYLPDERQPGEKFPVLYMFDGHNVFFDTDATYGKSWGMLEYMQKSRTPLIIAAVDCNHSRNHGRLREYSPFSFDDPSLGHITGKGRATMEWLINDLKPLIDSRYPTLPGRGTTFIAGSSMGGLMTVYALCAYGHVFSRGAALSPSLWTSPENILTMIRQSPYLEESVLYMDYGSQELENHDNMRNHFFQAAHEFLEKGAFLNFRIIPGGEHCEACWEEQLPFFIPVLLYKGFHSAPDPFSSGADNPC